MEKINKFSTTPEKCKKHLFSYYWKRGKCKGSRCSLCGHLDRDLKPKVT